MQVRSLHVYPLKGARAVDLVRAEVLASGIRHDRRFMALGADGSFITQREHPRMALVEVAIGDGMLTISVGGSRALVPLTPEGPRRRASVWDDEVDAVDVGGDGAALLSDHLGERCSLVFMPLDVIRPVEDPYGAPGDRVGFADGYPLLIASLASLTDLNERLAEAGAPAVTIDRFRANIVIDGAEPFTEDEAAAMSIGALHVRTPKPCARCKVTTVDQASAAVGHEPLKTLATYRTVANKVNFAMNAIPDLAGDASVIVAVGDAASYG